MIRLLMREGFVPAARAALWFALPWGVFYTPLLIWTAYESGSPFGPVLPGICGKSCYSEELISRVRQEMQWHQSRGMTPFFVAKNLPLYSALFVFGVIAASLIQTAGRVSQCLVVLLLGVQTIVVVFIVSQYELRFYGGLLQGLVIHAAMGLPEALSKRVTQTRVALLATVAFLVMPWFSAQLLYGSQFIPFACGMQSKEEYGRKYVSFYDDYKSLDRVLPKEAVILSRGYRVNGVYAPRQIYLTPEDLPVGKRVYLMQFGEVSGQEVAIDFGYRLGAEIYNNPNAIEVVNARLGGRPITWSVRVFELYGTTVEAAP